MRPRYAAAMPGPSRPAPGLRSRGGRAGPGWRVGAGRRSGRGGGEALGSGVDSDALLRSW